MTMVPKLIKGNSYTDERGTLQFNNDFNALGIKRMYTIQNKDIEFIRGWQGHKIEQRWFSAVQGSFSVVVVAPDAWENPTKKVFSEVFLLNSDTLDVLHVPAGYLTSIQSIDIDAKLLVMADYALGEIADEYRFSLDYFGSGG